LSGRAPADPPAVPGSRRLLVNATEVPLQSLGAPGAVAGTILLLENVTDRVRLEEQLQIVLGSWTSDDFNFEGEHYTLRHLDAQPKPVQRPHPPLIMGGLAGPRSAALAARYADEYNTVFPTVDGIRERQGRLAQACERAGRRVDPAVVRQDFVLAPAPTRVTVVPERDEQFVACLVADLPEEPALRDSGLVNAGNSLVDLPLMRVGPVLSSEAPIEGVS